MEIITIAQAAEHNFVGVKCGIMDQFASVMGRKNYVIQLDCQSMAFQYCHLDLGDYCFLLCNTNVKHSLADSDYNTRRTECQTGIAIIRESFPEIRSLRDVSIQMLDTCSLRMSNKIYNRCRYVIEENGRVLEAARDLENGDLIKLGKKMFLSHEGLSILYDVSCPELDFLVQFASQQESVLGSRMMGGGFGGCTLNLINYSAVESFINEAQMVYKAEFNRDLSCYIVQTGNGVTALQK